MCTIARASSVTLGSTTKHYIIFGVLKTDYFCEIIEAVTVYNTQLFLPV